MSSLAPTQSERQLGRVRQVVIVVEALVHLCVVGAPGNPLEAKVKGADALLNLLKHLFLGQVALFLHEVLKIELVLNFLENPENKGPEGLLVVLFLIRISTL